MEKLFGERGACGGCWCMWWRIKRREFEKQQGAGNREAMKAIVERNEVPGILGYLDDRPVAWCSVAPREVFSVLDRSPILKKVDDRLVWSIVCFFVDRRYRRQGISYKILQAAVAYAAENSATIVEAYPVIPKKEQAPDIYIYTGLFSTFEKAGFIEVCRRSALRPIMRRFITAPSTDS
jgi:GNAT superfamily N-acetyltransferase